MLIKALLGECEFVQKGNEPCRGGDEEGAWWMGFEERVVIRGLS